ncbi:Dual specificity phosphatase, catalytic domain and Dual specificity phosphatase, subgroup, catalytic domain-containing protein [Strongyloides ratti]|uniref:protein-tyrosine-phosphatase n=1 Tax=Strongyloides ratti TaxID=34506 RepID=A0A090KQ04_STRRB|nr:Dual specificity phosphatase, catalytic domain and Dual specificity phosphatase, subgroup, catalytic domain-containing protein [Strongyloides ratti]CEF59618.1 Dual specificity phosphatase, catalytic domain and Dual specificity phosphatase, subgroup, catalytic domain-containing protein [Strongyloides ratti]
MRRSHSQIAHGRHMVNNNLDKWNILEQNKRKHSLCRDGYNGISLETGHIHVYLKKEDSKNNFDNEKIEQINTSISSLDKESHLLSFNKNDWNNEIMGEDEKKSNSEEIKEDVIDRWQDAIISNSSVSLRLSDNENEQTTDERASLITAISRRNVYEKELMANTFKKEPVFECPKNSSNKNLEKNNSIPTKPIFLNKISSPITIPKPRCRYNNEIVWQVDETVYCGGIEAVSNLNLLCRLNIEYIVDLSGLDEEVTSRRNECPCLCSRKTPHSRMIMAIKLNDEELLPKQNLMPFFEDVVKLISRANVVKKCVLIHSIKGRNRAPAFVAAYMMHKHHITRVQAVTRISDLTSKIRPGINISDNLQRALMKWQSMQGIRSQDVHLDAKLVTPLFSVKKTAWT